MPQGTRIAAACAAAASLLAAPAAAQVPTGDLGSALSLRLTGPPVTASLFIDGGVEPAWLSGGGDVNGDGIGDFIVGSPSAAPGGRPQAGSAHVVFGGTRGSVDLASPFPGGFRIDGAPSAVELDLQGGLVGDRAGSAVAPAGDVNGDGLADVVVGAPGSSARLRVWAGAAYVVFGKPDGGTVDLGALGQGGYRVDGNRSFDTVGVSLAPLGDLSGDGRPDLVVGGNRSGFTLVHGQAGSDPVDLREPAGRAEQVAPADAGDELEDLHRVAPAGDVNGDGLGDMLLRSAVSEHDARLFVIYGRPGGGPVDLGDLGDRGYAISSGPNAFVADAFANAGDVNGDGRADTAVVLQQQDDPGPEVAIVFGRAGGGAVELGRLGRGGYVLDSGHPALEGGSITAVTGLGDVNGDGRSDIALGVPFFDNGCRVDTGAVYVVHGRARPGTIDLDRLGDDGFRLLGRTPGASAGAAIAGPGDVTGDGRPDVLLGAPGLAEGASADDEDQYEPEDEDDRVLRSVDSLVGVVDGRPAALRSTPTQRPARCVSLRFLDRDLDRVARTGRIRVRVTSRLRTAGAVSFLVAVGLDGRGDDAFDVLTGAQDMRLARFRRPGTRTLSFRLPRRFRQRLARASRVRLRASAEGLLDHHQPRATVTLR